MSSVPPSTWFSTTKIRIFSGIRVPLKWRTFPLAMGYTIIPVVMSEPHPDNTVVPMGNICWIVDRRNL